jgi:2-amino-4-hydroxy-6-hydroxymethyldihydropteridine diphosphokinase
MRCYIGLGANLGEPLAQLRAAVAVLAREPAMTLADCSPVYSSAPLGPQDQPDYLNAVAAVDTALPPAALLLRLKSLEARAGRVPGRRWGPRVLDLDLLLYGALRIATAQLTVPHPGMGTRAFVLRPLADLCGRSYRLPDGRDIGTLLDRCPGGGVTPLDAVLLDGEAGTLRE